MSLLRSAVLLLWCIGTVKAVDCNPNEILVSTSTGKPFLTENCSTNGCGPVNYLKLLLSHIEIKPRVESNIAFRQTATEEFDGDHDAWYIRPFTPGPTKPFEGVMLASVIEKYSNANPEPAIMSINSLPTSVLSDKYTVPLYHFAGKDAKYTIAMIEMENFPGDYTIILNDSKVTEDWEAASHILNTGPYTFLGDPSDNSNAWVGDAGKLGSDRFSIDIVPTIDGYASCQTYCGAAESRKKCKKNKAFKSAGCKWVTADDDWPEVTNPSGECINPVFIEVNCSAVKKGKCSKTFPYSSRCKWLSTAARPKGECLDLDDEDYTALTCDLATKGNGKPNKKKCLSKPFKKIDCKWKKSPNKECVEKD